MPAELPPNSAYTYAVELSVDEALAAGDCEPTFSRPVLFYLENFIQLPVGASAPLGSYDRIRTHSWCCSESGRVMRVLDIAQGMAVLSVDGTGQPASAEALASLGVTEAELAAIAELYGPGQTVMRVSMKHFSPQDLNMPYGIVHGFQIPLVREVEQQPLEPETCDVPGSIVEVENQVLGQQLPISGTPYALTYRSRRTAGYKAPQSLTVSLVPLQPGDARPKEIQVEATVAGRVLKQTFSPETFPFADPRITLTWDGRDGYGRLVQGAQKASVNVAYTYPIIYRSQADLDIIFNEWTPAPASVASRAAASYTFFANPSFPSDSPAGQLTLSALRAPVGDLGGWSLSVHEDYDPSSRTLLSGTGRLKTAGDIKQTITTIAGNGHSGDFGNGGPATHAQLNYPRAVAVDAEGNLYIADTNNHRILKINTTGTITTIAGTGQPGHTGDGGPATKAKFNGPKGIAVAPDGHVYVADTENNAIRRIDARTGTITTVAADRLALSRPHGICLAPDGTLYIGDTLNHRVWRIRQR
jgi:hypothetical protein